MLYVFSYTFIKNFLQNKKKIWPIISLILIIEKINIYKKNQTFLPVADPDEDIVLVFALACTRSGLMTPVGNIKVFLANRLVGEDVFTSTFFIFSWISPVSQLWHLPFPFCSLGWFPDETFVFIDSISFLLNIRSSEKSKSYASSDISQ